MPKSKSSGPRIYVNDELTYNNQKTRILKLSYILINHEGLVKGRYENAKSFPLIWGETEEKYDPQVELEGIGWIKLVEISKLFQK